MCFVPIIYFRQRLGGFLLFPPNSLIPGPPKWCNDGAGGCGFDPQSGHTKDLIKMVEMAALGVQDCGVSITNDWLISE